MALVVSGIGALVLFYCAWYFHDDAHGLGYFAGSFTSFAGAMLGLVLSDDLLVMYVFWELTTVFSYLLIGYDADEARQPGSGDAGAGRHHLRAAWRCSSASCSSGPRPGPSRSASWASAGHRGDRGRGRVLLLLGAVTKSAMVPFHFWLPGAMAAPTPVSAYLHAAAMVKAGVYLVALLAPVFAGVPGWRGSPAAARRARRCCSAAGGPAAERHQAAAGLRHRQPARLPARRRRRRHPVRGVAALAMLVAHALFKAALFLVVGIVDHQAGTRDLRELSRRRPVHAPGRRGGGPRRGVDGRRRPDDSGSSPRRACSTALARRRRRGRRHRAVPAGRVDRASPAWSPAPR